MTSRLTAILQAVFVTFLWSTSWVLIKIGLRGDLPAVSFAGLRYGLATLCLAPLVLFIPKNRLILKSLSGADLGRLVLLGIILYTLTQSLVYLSLAYLPATMVSLVLNLTSAFVAIAGISLLKEIPSLLQWTGIGMAAIGVGVYFLPVAISKTQVSGLVIVTVCMLVNVAAALFGREINRSRKITPLIVTFVSMGIGSALMLLAGGITQGFGTLTGKDWAIIAWLAVVNTAFAFTVWNNTLRTLTATESSILNSLMLPQTVILAAFFQGEGLTTKEIIGLLLVFSGVIVVQIKRRKSNDR